MGFGEGECEKSAPGVGVGEDKTTRRGKTRECQTRLDNTKQIETRQGKNTPNQKGAAN